MRNLSLKAQNLIIEITTSAALAGLVMYGLFFCTNV